MRNNLSQVYLVKKNLIFILNILFFIFLAGIFISSLAFQEEKISYFQPQKGVHVFSIDLNYFLANSEIYVSDTLKTVESAGKFLHPKIIINGGFFDPTNQKTISYILKDGQIIQNPLENENLTQNEKLKPYLDKILNRSELRSLKCVESSELDIQQHDKSLPDNCQIKYSLQAGPELFPELKLEEEFFIVKNNHKIVRQSAGALLKMARTALGYDDKRVYIFIAETKPGMSLPELSEFIKKMDLKKAVAFDGGSSTSVYAEVGNRKIIINSCKDLSARKVKSFLFVK